MSASHTEALAGLKGELAAETAAARTIEAEADAAHADLAAARDAVITAHADNNAAAVKKATAARDKAEGRVAELGRQAGSRPGPRPAGTARRPGLRDRTRPRADRRA
jgi:hypothetical protein